MLPIGAKAYTLIELFLILVWPLTEIVVEPSKAFTDTLMPVSAYAYCVNIKEIMKNPTRAYALIPNLIIW